MKDKMKEQKHELKRREEKIAESDIRIRKLEDQMKGFIESLKAQEDSNKQLKAELRKKAAAKEKKEAGPAPVV